MLDQPRYVNREISWLDFNARVLALAEDETVPLLGRAKFLEIFSSNLDEFFQVRVAGLKEQVAAGIGSAGPDGLDQVAQLRAIHAHVEEMVARQAAVFTKDIAPALASAGILFVDWQELDADDRAHLGAAFQDRIFPVLTPLAVDPAHPFPYISNLSLNLAVVVRDSESGDERFARVKVPPLLPRFIAMPDRERFVPLEQVIAAHLDWLFPGMEILADYAFRVTRDADIALADESEDLITAMEDVLRRRTKFGPVVRLEVDARMTHEVVDLLQRELAVQSDEVYVIDGPLDLTGLSALYSLPRPDLKYAAFTPQTPRELAGDTDLFAVLRRQDVFVHHPYDSFSASVESFLATAARDPSVLAIKQTLYRTSDDESAIISALVKAAGAGKQVVALVELKARFDEQTNIERARELEEAGVHVVYGIVGLKTHAKLALVVRQEPDGIRRYCHVGTGNYNPTTAKLYEDLGVLTSDAELGDDLSELFNRLTGYSRPARYRRILVAPDSLRSGVSELISGQAHPEGRIAIKINALADQQLIDDLYAAAAAGAQIDLIVRGICCLRAGVPGLSETIRVRSIVGRYLEHSRIFRFGEPGSPGATYLTGSADLMPRNLDRRVEALVRITDERSRARLDEILDVDLADESLAWTLEPDDSWRPVRRNQGLDAHSHFQQLAIARARKQQGG